MGSLKTPGSKKGVMMSKRVVTTPGVWPNRHGEVEEGKEEDQDAAENNEITKRQHRWNSKDVNVSEQQSVNLSPETYNELSSCLFVRSRNRASFPKDQQPCRVEVNSKIASVQGDDSESWVLISETTFVGVESRVLIPETTVWDTLVYPSDTLVIRKQKLE
ncbi:hypothetical protein Tco_0939739 [Tanacetum coccineum]|uniref:Uncharacterized protein n=1 Tax=Tanacetum coccineum TaxID=301880 RepID=A0ABQ5DLN6_9ASTR